MPIDMHSHYYGGLIEHLKARRSPPNISIDAQGRQVLNAMTASTLVSAGYTDVPSRLAYLDEAGIHAQLMTFPGALGVDVMPADEVESVIREFNDGLAQICRASGGRLMGLAGLPLADMHKAAAELRRVRRDLGLLGAILPGNFFLMLERASTLRPLFAAADEVGSLFMIHPGLVPGELPPQRSPEPSLYRTSGVELQASIAQMGITLIFGDLLDNFPNIAIQLVNLGGTLPFVLERLEAIGQSRMGRPFPCDRLRLLYYDCASLGPRALRLTTEVVGADRIMLGTDYPILRPNPVIDAVAAASIDASQRELVLHGTAFSLVSRFA